MTRDELITHLESELSCDDGNGGPANIYGIRDAADRILAALEKEREGEVVLCKGRVDFAGWTECNGPNCGGKQIGKQGQLIFRPTKAKEAGK